ncbi:putative SAWADEE domain-containing protein [Rosa chinensis]|uniref:Putative SAWADEE domain-containing protein n=1 Tax=Rosa chinensis TaxID=74649 RepID=A0A2P6PAW8_ROSCH|nr:uncharacterized protein LOC112177125 [Rosa chinensis]XP_024171107.1 uncharacterized protein LOC112177125 [Rosa chinensis]PRQ19070.1 putative SAWADEE domain-containing protein [Rosa chinensis]
MDLEFRSCVDDAWYHVRIETDGDGGDRLRVKFVGFSDHHDEVYDAEELTSFGDVEEFRSRFRRMSIQVQDWECRKVVKGTVVCAAISIGPDDCRFYDDVVDRVVHKEHQLVKGKEECSCNFILFWKHGPKARSLTAQTVENICRVQPPVDKLDPLLTTFLDTATEKIETILSSIFKIPHEASHHREPCTPNCREELSFSKRLNKDTSLSRRSVSKEMIDNPLEKDEHDMDIGGVPYMLLVENLEKGISPFTIMEFIHQQATISCQASVWPSKSSEAYTRGTIIVDSKRNLEKISDFLENPDHIIISSKGRPWVMTEKSTLHETPRASIQSFMLMSQTILHNRSPTTKIALKVVISGTKEYETAKLLKDLFLAFVKHQSRLHRRLLIVEGKISHLML